MDNERKVIMIVYYCYWRDDIVTGIINVINKMPKMNEDVDKLVRDFNFKQETYLEEGLSRFVSWHKSHYM